MAAEDQMPPGRLPGFHSYADDAPRYDDDDAWDAAGDEPPPRRRWPLVAGGGAVAAVLAGVLVAVGQGDRPNPPAAPERVDNPEARATPMAVEVTPPVPPPPPAATGKLDVLPPPAARPAAPPWRQAAGAPPPVMLPIPGPTSSPAPRVTLPQPAHEAAAPPAADTSARAASDPCDAAESRAQRMVCRDADLAAADRRLRRAYAAALAASDAPRDLRLEQEDWLDIREQAAAMSRQAVASIYRQRTEELERLADPD